MKHIILLICLLYLTTPAHADDDISVHVVSYGFIEADQAVEQAKLFLSPAGKVAANKRNNTLIVVDSPAVAEKIQTYFRDMPPLQNVHIEVQVTEAADSSNQLIGIPIGSRSLEENRVINLTVLEGGHASILVGEHIPYPTFFQEFLLTHGYIVAGVTFEEVGTKLDVQPRLSGNQAEIIVTPVISFIADRERRSIAVREMSTTIRAANGQTVELGGSPQSGEFTSNFFRNQHQRAVRFTLTPSW